jgi:hypothetical protein
MKDAQSLSQSPPNPEQTSTVETRVRFRNRRLPWRALNQVAMTDLKQSCVGDYSCCGHMP